MREYILQAPLTAPRDSSDAPDRLRQLATACREILADEIVSAQEADALRRWLAAAGWLKRQWPASVIAARVERMLDVPDKRELSDLAVLLSDVIKEPALNGCDEVVGLFDEPLPKISFEDQTFVLTGVFYFGSRAKCEEEIAQRGGLTRRSVSGSTSYIVIGGICNPQWLHANAGTKIEAAQQFRKEAIQWNVKASNSPRILTKNVPAVIRERDWVEALLDHPQTLTISQLREREAKRQTQKQARREAEALGYYDY